MIISEWLNHDAIAVNFYIKNLIEELKKQTTVTEVIYFTDGTASQYKNKSNFINLAYHPNSTERSKDVLPLLLLLSIIIARTVRDR